MDKLCFLQAYVLPLASLLGIRSWFQLVDPEPAACLE